ncbi:hypothetical protein CLIB1444_22S00166 [[Candida] jaroonii]|uniref:Uncharacterized protein n=1 Tax=[Candida] jaroonii TaxID=467808 RepID=A0ACA9YFN4_9ASCO|nr:hypothetical protein CLIB1444_22S00166 [[Candida] jaroonii]
MIQGQRDYQQEGDFYKVLSSLPSYSFVVPKSLVENNGSLMINLKLFKILQDDNNEKSLKFILKHLEHNLHHELIEFFVYKNIGNYFVTPFLQKIFHSYDDFVLSNEIWSIYMTSVCQQMSLEGAKLIYHNVIDNYRLYEDLEVEIEELLNPQIESLQIESLQTESLQKQNPQTQTQIPQTESLQTQIPQIQSQTHYPFLITPQSLEQLSTIFLIHNKPGYIDGLIHYFKQFYSIHGHKDCYKHLLISSIESYSKKCNVHKAMETFITLSNHYKYSRNAVIVNNQLQKSKDHNCDISRIPVFKKSIPLNELPMFCKLINRILRQRVTAKPLNFINWITSTHFNLTRFLVKELTSLASFQDALIVMSMAPRKTGTRIKDIFSDDMFLHIMKNLKLHIHQHGRSYKRLYHRHNQPLMTLNETFTVVPKFMKIFIQFKHQEFESTTMFRHYLEIIVHDPEFHNDLIDKIIPIVVERGLIVELGSKEYKKLVSVYPLEDSIFKDHIRLVYNA